MRRYPIGARFSAGFTLVEMLVATAASLLLLGALATMFGSLGTAVDADRRALQLEARLRSVRMALAQDLAGVTVSANADGLTLPVESAAAAGYFEVVEGPNTDLTIAYDQSVGANGQAVAFDKSGAAPGPTAASDDRIVGDTDDVLLFTTESYGDAFQGRVGDVQTESPVAEVAWFCRPTPGTSNPVTYTLYRRQLLVMGYVGVEPFLSAQQTLPFATFGNSWANYFEQSDVSCRRVVRNGASFLLVNTLADLSKRENRFLHDTPAFANRAALISRPGAAAVPAYPFASRVGLSASESVFDMAASARGGEDIMLTDVIAFDVKVFDGSAVVRQASAQNPTKLFPGDVGYTAGVNTNPALTGAFVDLAYGRKISGVAPSDFSDHGVEPKLSVPLENASVVYDVFDTWCDIYDTNDDLTDDGGPPYATSVTKVQITLRCYEPNSKVIRQVTVVHQFD